MAIFVSHFQPKTGDPAINESAQLFRQMIAGLVSGGQGVFKNQTTGAIVKHHATGADFSVDVQPWFGVVQGDDVTDQGVYLVAVTSVVNVVMCTSAPASGTRTHRLVFQIRDARANPGTWTTYDGVHLSLQDTGSGQPAEPASALTLASVSVSAGQASIQDSNITEPTNTLLRVLRIMTPSSTDQAGAGSWNVNTTWTDFSGANWPPLTFTVPPSGRVWVTISGMVIANALGIAHIGWRISGTDTVAHSYQHAISTIGTSASGVSVGASKRFLVTGLTPGGTDTITPGWYQTASIGGDGYAAGFPGRLEVEMVQ